MDLSAEIPFAGTPSPPAAKRRRQQQLERSDFRSCADGKPKGPESLQELMDWPSWVTSTVMQDPDRAHRVKQLLQGGVRVVSDYSGLDAPRECLTQLSKALQDDHGVTARFYFQRSCDHAALPQRVLTYLATEVDAGNSCVFADLEDRLTEDAREQLNTYMPKEDDTKEVKELAFQMIRQWVAHNRMHLFHEHATAYCLVHHKECPVLTSSYDLSADRYPRPLRMSVAGTTCVGWSSAGKQERFAHDSERTHAVWLGERQAKAEMDAEDIFFQECVAGYPSETKIRDPLFSCHQVLTVKTGPEMLGWPTSRPRRFTAGLNRRRLGGQG